MITLLIIMIVITVLKIIFYVWGCVREWVRVVYGCVCVCYN